MNKLKTIIRAPLLTCSGYSELSRDVFKYLSKDERLEIFADPVSWGNASLWYGNKELREKIIAASQNHVEYIKEQKEYDISIQIFTAVEFKKLAKVNVGITAGIESDCVLPSWNEYSNNMDLLVVPSIHSKVAFENQKEIELKVPVYICPYGADIEKFESVSVEKLPDNLKFSTKYNFLAAGQWIFGNVGEDRKQFGLLIKLFLEAFKDRSDVGLILKTFKYKNSILDFHLIKKQILEIKETVKATTYPAIYLVHGYLPLELMIKLYKHPRVIAYISPSSGEGYGRHFIEVAMCEKPIMCVYWSGQTDFLDEDLIIKIPYELKQIPPIYPQAMPAFFNPNSKWAYPKFQEMGELMHKIVNDYKNDNYQQYKDNAKKLKENIKSKLNQEAVYRQFCDKICETATKILTK